MRVCLVGAPQLNSQPHDAYTSRTSPVCFAAITPQVCLVGSRQFNTFGAHGSSEHVDFCHYHTLEECVQDLKQKKGEGDCCCRAAGRVCRPAGSEGKLALRLPHCEVPAVYACGSSGALLN